MQNVRQCQEAYQLPRADREERAFAEVKGSGQHPSTERQRLGAGQGMGQEHSAMLQAEKQKESCRVSQDCSSVSLPPHQAGLLHSHPLTASPSLALHSREMKLQRLSLGCLAEQKNPHGKQAGKAEGVGERRGGEEGLSMAPKPKRGHGAQPHHCAPTPEEILGK